MINNVFLFIALLFIAILFMAVFVRIDHSWTEDGDKMYGFMCYECDLLLEDGEGKPRLCKKCKLSHDEA